MAWPCFWRSAAGTSMSFSLSGCPSPRLCSALRRKSDGAHHGQKGSATASRDPYVNFGRAMPIGGLILLDLLLGGIACVIERAIPRTVLIGWSALATGIVVFAANSVCVYYMERYTLPMLVTALIALLSALDWIAHQSLEICERSRLRKAAVSFCNS
jgi:hypothetical protein